jgi:hypothetical protein
MSVHSCPTVRVKHPSRGFAIINESDLTPDHELFDAPAAHSGPVAPVEPVPAPDAAQPAESRPAPANEPRRGNRRR